MSDIALCCGLFILIIIHMNKIGVKYAFTVTLTINHMTAGIIGLVENDDCVVCGY